MVVSAADYKIPQSVMQDYRQKGLNPYNSMNTIVTQDVVDHLEQAIALSAQGKTDDALHVLDALQPALLMAKLTGSQMEDHAKSDEANAHSLSDVLIRCAANLVEHEKLVRQAIQDANVAIQGDQKRVTQDQAAMAKLQALIDQLQSDIDDFNARCEEAEKWSWVPGYNVYLACRTLKDAIDGKFRQQESARADLDQYNGAKYTTQVELATATANLAKMTTDSQTWQDQESSLKTQQASVEDQIKYYSGRTVVTANLALYIANTAIAVESVSNNLDSVLTVANRLADPVQVYNPDGSISQGPLKDALLALGKSADRWVAQHQHW